VLNVRLCYIDFLLAISEVRNVLVNSSAYTCIGLDLVRDV
jgi:hypothetical protein